MIIVLYGPDSYRRLKKLEEIVRSYREKQSGLSYERFELTENGDFLKFKIFASNRSIFDPVRLVVLDDPFVANSLKELKEILKANQKSDDLVIVINSDKKPPTTFATLLKSPTQVQEFPALKDRALIVFIKKIAASLELDLELSMTSFLAETFGSDTWGIATELEQMALSASYLPKRKIRPLANNYWQLINSIKYGREARERLVALEIILSERRDEPGRVFNSLAYRLRNETEANLFADYDVTVKSGKLEYEEVLLDYALS